MKASGPKTHPVEDEIVKLYTLFGTLKTIAYSAAHICLGQIRECPPLGYGHKYITDSFACPDEKLIYFL